MSASKIPQHPKYEYRRYAVRVTPEDKNKYVVVDTARNNQPVSGPLSYNEARDDMVTRNQRQATGQG